MKRSFRNYIVTFAFVLLLLPVSAFAKEVKVTVLPFGVTGPAFLQGAVTGMITARIGSDADVELTRGDLLSDEIKTLKASALGEPEARKLGEKLGSDFVVYGMLAVTDTAVKLDSKLLDMSDGSITPFVEEGKSVGEITILVSKASASILKDVNERTLARTDSDATYVGRFSEPKDEGPEEDYIVISRDDTRDAGLKWRSANIDGFYKGMVRADLDGDGTGEFFLMGELGVLVAKFSADGLVTIEELVNTDDALNLYISAGDTDGDGTIEIYISKITEGVPNVSIVQYTDGRYSQTAVETLARSFVRVIEIPGKGSILIKQGFSIEHGLSKKLLIAKKGGSVYLEAGELDVPLKIRARGPFGFEFIDMTGDGTSEIVSLDFRFKLHIYKRGAENQNKWENFWVSKEVYGGSLNMVELTGPLKEKLSIPELPVLGSFTAADLNEDGLSELIIKRNDPGGVGRFLEKNKSYDSGNLFSFSWDVALLEENWKTKDVNGYIADFIVADLDGDGKVEITMLVVEDITLQLGKKRKEKSYLLSHSLF